MSDNWIVQNLENALETWNEKLAEIWQLITQSPEQFKGGTIWNVIVGIHGAVQAIGLALLVLFFVVGVMKTCGSFAELKRPEHALKVFIRFALAKAAVTYGLELMIALFNIVQGLISTIMNAAGFGAAQETVLPAEIVTAVEDCGFFESIPLWAVTLIGGLFITVLSFIMIMTVYGRFFKLYLYTAIAPVPLSAFAGEPSQNIGKSFIKSYAAVCLDSDTETVLAVARKHMCQLAVLKFQQLDGLNTVLPIGTRRINAFRTLTTESLAVFMPFKVQEVQDKGGIYFGENAISHNLIMCNKANLLNQSAFLLGVPGSGKSFSAKELIAFLILNTADDVLVCDPENEFGALAAALGKETATVIHMAAGGKDRLNAMYMVDGYGENNPIVEKSQFIMSLVEQIDKAGVGPQQKSIIDRCTALVYQDAERTGKPATLCDLRNKLLEQPEEKATEIALSLELFTTGSLDIFGHESTVDLDKRIVVFDIHGLGEQLKPTGLLVITDTILNRVTLNWKKGKRTHIFIDEFHVVFENEQSGIFFNSAWRQFRKRKAKEHFRQRQAQKSIKTLERGEKTIKQTAKSTGKSTIKTAKGSVKTAQKTVKTAEQTARTAIKTSEQAAKVAQKTAQASAKAARTAAQAAKATAKATVATIKAAAKATVAAVKAIIAGTKALISAIAAGGWVAVVIIIVVCLIALIVGSCFGIFFSGEDSGSSMTMQSVVQEINTDYQTQLDTTKTNISYDVLEMSGSRAVWPEVLAVYAVKTTTDPNNPQDVATMDASKKAILKDIFWQMNTISSRTETKTEEIITETDDGHGNIVETKTTVTRTYLYISVAHKTAGEMADKFGFNADQRKQLAELLAEENRSMWSAVLYGIYTEDGQIVSVALSQIGNVGGQPYWSWYGFDSRVEWCACFVSWAANECGYIDSGIIPKFAGCTNGVQWFKDRGQWIDNSATPSPGMIIFFDWNNKGSSGPQDGLSDHVGIVERVEDGIIYTIEGNSGDSCRENHYAVGHYEILGYGVPAH